VVNGFQAGFMTAGISNPIIHLWQEQIQGLPAQHACGLARKGYFQRAGTTWKTIL
jgi:hypothetical protein